VRGAQQRQERLDGRDGADHHRLERGAPHVEREVLEQALPAAANVGAEQVARTESLGHHPR